MTIERLISEEKPEMIYCHHPNDIHQDHRSAARATMSAGRNHNRILFAEGYESNHFSPTVFSDISKSMDKKLQIMKAHASQDGHIKFEQVKLIARFRGSQIGVEHAEGFEPHRYLLW